MTQSVNSYKDWFPRRPKKILNSRLKKKQNSSKHSRVKRLNKQRTWFHSWYFWFATLKPSRNLNWQLLIMLTQIALKICKSDKKKLKWSSVLQVAQSMISCLRSMCWNCWTMEESQFTAWLTKKVLKFLRNFWLIRKMETNLENVSFLLKGMSHNWSVRKLKILLGQNEYWLIFFENFTF